jgi:hydroxyethylthiazole kinase-like uncharacterized protein yjeF
MAKRRGWLEWGMDETRDWIAVPSSADDKYSRGVLGIRTGSDDYPGAAVLGVDAAIRTGVGMVRYLGPSRASDLVLQRRPEAVTMPGRVQAWLLGSGMSSSTRDEATTKALDDALAEGLPSVVDAGALDRLGGDGKPGVGGSTVITPHHRELAGLLASEEDAPNSADIAAHPDEWAVRGAKRLGVTVLLKGSVTHVASPSGARLTVSNSPAWLATAGTGDVLAGILGSLLATQSERAQTDADALAALAASAVYVHAEAARRASSGGPISALDVSAAVPATIAGILRG